MIWTWDDAKSRANKRVHRLTFETAQLVFNDPLSLSRRDPYPREDRWQTMGMIGNVVVFVVHTWPEDGFGRIISARKATAHERRAYESGDF
jgi:uncharacterized protein